MISSRHRQLFDILGSGAAGFHVTQRHPLFKLIDEYYNGYQGRKEYWPKYLPPSLTLKAFQEHFFQTCESSRCWSFCLLRQGCVRWLVWQGVKYLEKLVYDKRSRLWWRHSENPYVNSVTHWWRSIIGATKILFLVLNRGDDLIFRIIKA